MMLDMKRTFDEVVESQATPEKAKQILENPFYIALSSSFAGTQEYMAMEKLGQIHEDAQRDGSYDLIVVDTPPSRSALDFLDAPERLSSFLDGRFIRLLLAPARGPARMMTAGVGLITNALTKILGAQVLRDMQTFVHGVRHPLRRLPAARAEDLRAAPGRRYGVPGGRRARAGRAARGGVLRRAARARTGCRSAGLVVNRASPAPVGDLSADEAMAAAARLRKQEPDGASPRACCGCTPTGPGWSSARRGCATGSPRRTRRCRRRSCRRSPATCTTSTGLRRVGELLADG